MLVRGERIAWVNRASCALMGLTPEAMVGKPYDEFLARGEGDRVRGRRDRRLRGGHEPTLYQVTAVGADGRVIPLELHVAPLGPDELLLQFVDMSERSGHLERLEGLARLGTRVQRLETREAVLDEVFRGLLDLGLSAVRLRQDGDAMLVERFAAPEEVSRVLRAAGLEGEPVGRRVRPLRWAWRDGSMFITDAPAASERIEGLPPGTREAVREARLERAIAMRVGDPADSVLAVVGDWFAPADAPAFRLFGAQVTAALASAETRAADWGRNQLVEVSATAAGLAEFFARGSQVVQEALSCDGVAIWLLDAERDDLLLGHFLGESPDLLAPFARIPVARSRYFGPLLRGGRPALLRLEDLDEPERGAFGRAGFQSFATVPLRIRSRVVGVMTVGFRDRRSPDEGVVGTMRGLADPFAAAVETQRLVDDLRRRVSELELMNVTAMASSTMNVRSMLGEALGRMLQTFGADMGAAYLLEGDVLSMQAIAGGISGSTREMLGRLPATRGAPGEALRTLRPVSLVDMSANDLTRALRDGEGVEVTAVVPLVVKHRALGVFGLGRRRPLPFREVELQLLSAVAAQLGVAVENSRLFEDLTRSYAELGRAQQQLVHRERLAALGELSAVVAHEVRNPLAAIFNSLASLQRILRPDGDAKLLLGVIQEESDRLNRIVGDLLDFARPAEPSLGPERLDRVLDEAAATALAGTPPGIEVRREHDASLPPVIIDAHQIRQALLNLASNAVQSMPRGGVLTLRTRAEGGQAVVEVADSGPGVPPELRARIFEPFFTTKATGTGLGLAVVRRIAEAHGGSVALASPATGGATFVLKLPLAPATRDRMGEPTATPSP